MRVRVVIEGTSEDVTGKLVEWCPTGRSSGFKILKDDGEMEWVCYDPNAYYEVSVQFLD
ncbi:MAG: hypothetical protein L0Z48_10675 [candidate division Zixibacteria bacterium]|nr:hypothetical protein [candidate division Zixibacteria bacterium]